MKIPDEAVEAAKVAIHRASLDVFTHEEADVLARTALAAAAPFIAAQALVDAARDVAARGDIGRDGGISAWNYLNSRAELARNPYRSGT